MYSYTFANLLGASMGSHALHMCFDRYARCLYTPTSNRIACYRLHYSIPSGTESTAFPTATSAPNSNRNIATYDKRNSSNNDTIAPDIEEDQSEAPTAETVNTSQVQTLPFEARHDIQWFCLRSDGLLAISIDAHGHALVVNILKGCVVNRIQLKSNTSSQQKKTWKPLQQQHHRVAAAAFAPDDSLFAVALGRTLQIWKAPTASSCYQLLLLRSMTLHQQEITSLCWSPDSTHAVTGSLDCTVRLWRVRKYQQPKQQQQQGRRDKKKRIRQMSSTSKNVALDGEQDENEEEEEGEEEGEVQNLAVGDDTATDIYKQVSTARDVGLFQRKEQQQQKQQAPQQQSKERSFSQNISPDPEATADEEFLPLAFVAHRSPLKFVCFSACLTRIISVNSSGGIVIWRWTPHRVSATTAESAKNNKKRRKRKQQEKEEEKSKCFLRRRVGVARVIHPSARQKRARLLQQQKLQEEREKEDEGDELQRKKMSGQSTSTGSVTEQRGDESVRDEEIDEQQEEEQQQQQDDNDNDDDDDEEHQQEEKKKTGHTLNYMRGIWKTEAKAYCRTAAGPSSRAPGSAVVTHACTNISPYYRSTRMRGFSSSSAGEVSSDTSVNAVVPVKTSSFASSSASSSSASSLSSRGEDISSPSHHADPKTSPTTAAAAGEAGTPLPAQYLLVGLIGGVLQLYELPSLCVLTRICLGLSSVDAVAISYDGEWLAAAAAGGGEGGGGGIGREGHRPSSSSERLIVWEWRSETYVLQQQSATYGIRCLAFSPAVAAVATSSNQIAAATGRRVGSTAAGNPAVAAATQSISTQHFGMGLARGIIAAGGTDGRVKLYDTESGFCCCSFSLHAAAVTAVTFSPTGNALFSASLDGTVRAYDLLRFRQFSHALDAYLRFVLDMRFVQRNIEMIRRIHHPEKAMDAWEMNHLHKVFVATPSQSEAGFSARKGTQIIKERAATGEKDEAEEEEEVLALGKMKKATSYVQELPRISVQFSSLAVDAAGELLVAGGSGSCYTAFVWSVQTGKMIDELVGHEAAIAAVSFHPHPLKQGVVVTASADKRIQVWDLYARRSHGGAPETLRCETEIHSLAFDPQTGSSLAVGCAAGKLCLFDISLGNEEGLLTSWDFIREIQRGRRAVGDRRAHNNWASSGAKVSFSF